MPISSTSPRFADAWCGLPHAGCIPKIHGAVEAVPRGFVGTTGELGDVLAVRAARRAWDVRLPGNHLVELAVDVAGRRVYAFGGCEYAGGASRLELRTGSVRVLARPARRGATPRVCGARGAVAGATLVLAGRDLVLVSTETGRVLRDVSLGAEPLDVIALG